ncbi:MAG: carboxypeptidase-like regulatory domain-containing protein, partial [bacterium]|nr:carboxypeptidase-like regulatory domain-containing protein [bacterium]
MSLLFSVFMLQSGFAQQRSLTVSGKITSSNDGMGIPGASVVVEGTNKGTTTDFDGKYQINTESDAVLKISFMGFKTQRISVKNQTVVNVAMQVESADLKEVVVIGYGSQKKKVSTAATSLVTGKDIQ